jgi:flagellar biogenesis protein FliO
MVDDFLSAFAALIFVLALLALCVWALKRFGIVPGQPLPGKASKELIILESKLIDARNRLVVARWRGKEYLLAASPNGLKEIDNREVDIKTSLEGTVR